jgi:DNA-binding transcriptional ArsR family regulator
MPLRHADAGDVEKFFASAHRASTLLKALSHETRLLILCILAESERTVTEIEEMLGLQQAVVSQHLARLRMERLVDTRRDGRLVYYMIAGSEICAVVSALGSVFCRSARSEER